MVSVVVITKNEERSLARCLGSVAWVEQIVVVDAESTDRTREVAERHGAKVLVRPWPGFVEQWNFALSEASEPWILVMAADEWLPEDSSREIRSELASPRADGYAFNRATAFTGAFVRHAFNPDWQLRLFRKGRGRFEGGLVHESVHMDPSCHVARLHGRLLHLTYRSIHDHVERMNRYTDLAAATLRREGRSFSVFQMLVRPPAAFFKSYVLRRGCLDGMRGLVIGAHAAFYVFLKLAKRWELDRPVAPSFLEAAGTTPEDPDPGAAGQSG